MQVARDYGRGHDSSASRKATAFPDETEEHYHSFIRSLMDKGDFAQLEEIARQNRTEKGRLVGGLWKATKFYCVICTPKEAAEAKDSDYEEIDKKLHFWIANYPDSATPHIALALQDIDYAWFVRGDGFADSVSEERFRIFNGWIQQAKAELLLAAKMKDRDPLWYIGMLNIAKDEGWDRSHTRELLDLAVAFEPDYYPFYRIYSEYLMPQWYGEPGEINELVEEESAKVPGPDGSILYFQIAAGLACNREDFVEPLSALSFPKLKAGYTNLLKRYGMSNQNANRFAYMAYLAKDKRSARLAWKSISEVRMDVWITKNLYDCAFKWVFSD